MNTLHLSPELNRLYVGSSKDTEPALTNVTQALASARIAQPTCHTCGGEQFDSADSQRVHAKTSRHKRNFVRKTEWRKKNPDTQLSLDEYPWMPLSSEDMEDNGIEEEEEEEEEDVSSDDDEDSGGGDLVVENPRRRGKGGSTKLSSGLLWFVGEAEDAERATAYGVRRRLLVPKGTHGIHIDGDRVLSELRRLQLPLAPPRTQAELKQQKKQGSSGSSSGHLWGFVALNGGHFAGAIIDRQTGEFVAHKTFVRYTTRRKQGGSQTRQDNAMGYAANSAGAQIRRYNEAKLQEEIHALMGEWREWLDKCECLLVRVPKPNRQNFFAPASTSFPLRWSDERIREVPVPMARPSLAELRRIYVDITTVTVATVRPVRNKREEPVEQVEVEVESGSESDCTLEPEPRPDLLAFLHHVAKMIQDPGLADDEIVAYLCDHLEQFLDALSDPAVGLRYLTTMDGVLAHRTPTLLHVASLCGRPELVPFLLDNGEDPTVTSGHAPLFAGGVTAYEIAKDRQTRDIFRVYRSEHEGEVDGIEWHRARVPLPITREQMEEREERERQKKRKEKERKKQRDRDKRLALERKRAVAEADDEAMEQAMAKNRETHSAGGGSGNGVKGLTDAQLRARVLDMAYASAAGSWNNVVEQRRPVSPNSQRAIDRELRFQAIQKRMQKTEAAVAASPPPPPPPEVGRSSGSAARCTHCNRPLHGLVPFEQFDWQCCSLQCLHGHQALYGTQ
ncbi:hypothetical protein IW152_004660 [Coemansia sp. BCRC 34962]|nr:hypothetical protein IW152_004660 [Coemansia sp. BCRC 34962]